MFCADSAKAVCGCVLTRVAVPQLVESRILEAQGSFASVDFDEEVARATSSDFRNLEGSAGATGELEDCRRRLVDIDAASTSPARECVGLRAHAVDVANHPQGEIDQVRAEVSDRRATKSSIEAPVELDRRIEKLVGEPESTPEVDRADTALVNEFLHQ